MEAFRDVKPGTAPAPSGIGAVRGVAGAFPRRRSERTVASSWVAPIGDRRRSGAFCTLREFGSRRLRGSPRMQVRDVRDRRPEFRPGRRASLLERSPRRPRSRCGPGHPLRSLQEAGICKAFLGSTRLSAEGVRASGADIAGGLVIAAVPSGGNRGHRPPAGAWNRDEGFERERPAWTVRRGRRSWNAEGAGMPPVVTAAMTRPGAEGAEEGLAPGAPETGAVRGIGKMSKFKT